MNACSTAQPQNKWEYDAVQMAQAYQEAFLQGNHLRAQIELKHARAKATQSSNLKTLIDIELIHCAMQVCLFKQQVCQKASELLNIQNNKNQWAYLNLLNAQLNLGDIHLLPSQYHRFALAFIKKDKEGINTSLAHMKPLSSRLIASSLAKEMLNKDNIKRLIDELAFRGYKKPLILWLNLLMQEEHDKKEKQRLQAKIEILTSYK